MEHEEQKTSGQPQGEAGKVDKQYQAAFKKMVALMKGQGNMKQPRLNQDEVSDIVIELIQDRKRTAIAEFKKEAVAILDKKMEFDKEVKRLEQEFNSKIDAKKKEFTLAMQGLFKKIESIDEIERSYEDSLKGL
jgi:hypothetical protein